MKGRRITVVTVATCPIETSLQALLAARFQTQAQMVAALTDHPVLVGTGRENAVGALLQEFLPRRFEVLSGIIAQLDGDGRPRRAGDQADILVADTLDFPVLLRMEATAVVVPDSARAIIEVKSNLARRPSPSASDAASAPGEGERRPWQERPRRSSTRSCSSESSDSPCATAVRASTPCSSLTVPRCIPNVAGDLPFESTGSGDPTRVVTTGIGEDVYTLGRTARSTSKTSAKQRLSQCQVRNAARATYQPGGPNERRASRHHEVPRASGCEPSV